MERILLSIFILLVILSGYSFSEEIKQEFDKRQEFESFWDISTWGNDQQQYSTSNVLLDTVHGWVRLKISASPQGVKPVVAEITSKRNNFLYGSYRASIKFDNVPGGVVGWFVYRTTEDLHEIDVEYLTRDINNIHFTLHHVQTSVDYKMKPISFDPTADFHEYRFDWYPDKVLYFIDGQKVDSLTKKVPDAACTIMLNFWSANIAEWGGAAPTRDTYMYVDYMRYSSDLTSIKSQPTTEVPTSGKIYISSNNGTISITTEKTSSVNDNLSIFTVSGKRIYTDRNPVCTGAKKSWVWNASGNPSGTYLFTVGNYISSLIIKD